MYTVFYRFVASYRVESNTASDQGVDENVQVETQWFIMAR